MKIKLPRKRKKAYIKAKGSANYMGCVILSEILFEAAQTKKEKRKAVKFPSYKILDNGKIIVLKNW